MSVVVYTASDSFQAYIRGALDQVDDILSCLSPPSENPGKIHLLHVSSLGDDSISWLKKHATGNNSLITVACADQPNIREMLEFVQLGARGYCNSYMRSEHYQQMIRLLSAGQSWFPPQMLEQTFSLAQQAMSQNNEGDMLDELTAREKDTALAVSKGLSNKQIAEHLSISERTVKTHLTNIFKKLNIKDRVGLVLYLKKS